MLIQNSIDKLIINVEETQHSLRNCHMRIDIAKRSGIHIKFVNFFLFIKNIKFIIFHGTPFREFILYQKNYIASRLITIK